MHSIYDFINLTFISYIRTIEEPVYQLIWSEGDAFHRAENVRELYNCNGAGRKVGIISNGVDHIEEAQVANELSSYVDILYNPIHIENRDEGTAMLEIVYDIAPNSLLAFAASGNSESDMVNSINMLEQAGCNVICDDIIFFHEPVFEDGVIAQRVNQSYNNNIIYISSSGNQAQMHYIDDYSEGLNNFHQFSSTNDYLEFLTGDEFKIVLQWNDKYGQSSNDYDLYLFDNQGNYIKKSNDVQNGNDDPYELLSYNPESAGIFRIKILNYNGIASSRKLNLVIFGDGQIGQYNEISSAYGHEQR